MVVKRKVVSEQDGRNAEKSTVNSLESVESTLLDADLTSSPVSIVDLIAELSKEPNAVPSQLREAVFSRDADDELEEHKEVKKLKKLVTKIANRLEKRWLVEVLRGEDRIVGQDVFGVKITSKTIEHPPVVWTLDDLEEKPELVICTLRNKGSFIPGDYELLVEHVRFLIDENKVTRVDCLSDQLNGCLSKVQATKLFDFMIVKVIENLTFFPKISSSKTQCEFAQTPDLHYGVQLDTKEYVDQFTLDVPTEDAVAFGVTTRFLKDIFELRSHKVLRFKTMIRSWRAYGLLSPLTTYNDGHIQKIQIGGAQRGLYLFRVDDFTRRKEAVEASMKVTKHEE